MINDYRMKFIINLVRHKSVLHVGCADFPYTRNRIDTGRLLHDFLHKNCKRAIGIDISHEGLNILKKYDETYKVYHVSEFDADNHQFDYIVATEVIEHVGNPEEFLKELYKIAGSGSRLLISTPNAYSMKGESEQL